MIRIITEVIVRGSQNIRLERFELFGQNTETSNLEWQLFSNLKRNNLSSSPLSINTFRLGEGYNLSSGNNNNNNPPPEGLDSNIAVLVNILTRMNLMEEQDPAYY